MNAKNKYFNYYKPLIDEFLKKVEKIELPEIEKMPEPFLNYFGKEYFSAQQRIVFVGQDTKWWGDLRQFIKSEKEKPLSKLEEGFTSFWNHDFRDWGANRYHFWGFIMMFFAQAHGIKADDWTSIKLDKYSNTLDSFAWANCQPIEYYESTAKGLGVSREIWEKVREAGRVFYGIKHVIKALSPHVVVLLHKNVDDYFEDIELVPKSESKYYGHYVIEDKGIHVIKLCHPNYMRMISSEMPAEEFASWLNKKLFSIKQDSLIDPERSGEQKIIAKIQKIKRPDSKYDFIFELAKQLREGNMFMSYRGLLKILNDFNYRTDKGTEYVIDAKRCRVVSAAYKRAKSEKLDEDLADTIATVFVRPDFTYKYD